MTKFKGPGPNRYLLPSTVGMTNHDPTRERAPGYSFGTRYSYSTTYSPGPYYLESGLSNRGRANNAGFTLYGKPKKYIWEITTAKSPGPVYNINSSLRDQRAPAYTFGSPYKTVYKTDGPGPSTYSMPSIWAKSSQGAIIGGRTADSKGFAYDFAKTPSPAQYGNPYASLYRCPAITIGHRYNGPSNKNVTPGPNTYNPSVGWTNPSSPRFTMGIRHHDDIITLADVSD